MMQDVERVARVLAPHLEGGREFDQMPPDRRTLKIWRANGMCSTNDATQEDAIDAATAAISAMTPDIWNAAIEAAAEACEAERLGDPQDESDAAYDRAIDHCAQAIRQLKKDTGNA